MPADPTKPVDGGNNGSGLNNTQPEKPNDSDSKGKGQEDKGNKKPESQDNSNFIAKDKYEEDIKSRDGTISALQKNIDNLQKGLKSALGIEDQSQQKPEELIATLTNRISVLENENKISKVQSAVSSYLDNYQDEKGNTLTPQAKGYLQKKINAASVKPEEVETVVKTEITEFISIFGNNGSSVVTPKGSDKRPQAKGFNGGRDVNRPKNANQILEDVSNND